MFSPHCVSPCLLVEILPFSPVHYFALGYPIWLHEVTFGNSRARAISLEYKNTMFKYIYTLKCGGKKNIYFTEHDIYFTKLMFILKNINLELKSALRTKYIFYRILLYQATGDDSRCEKAIDRYLQLPLTTTIP